MASSLAWHRPRGRGVQTAAGRESGTARLARSGNALDCESRGVLAPLSLETAAVAEFLYWTGWRKSEALGLEWRNLDLKAGILRIEDSKSGAPRTLHFRALPDLAALIERQRDRTDTVQNARGLIVSQVFHREGKPIRDFRGAWVKASTAAGVRQVPHDFRRTAARNRSRAGVPERVIMALCGRRTRFSEAPRVVALRAAR